ncbi:MAG TPA: OFA family MFS transporter [Bryobacteraceae bacterium]|nr:OFA family MFS transporter [Bryobacteraceae bacterium]
MANDNNHKGWPALVGGGLLNIAFGSYYTWSVFVPALEKEFHWTRTQTSLVPTIDMVMLSVMFIVAGVLQNRIGPRAVALIGGLIFSGGLFLASFTESLGMLYLTWGLMVGIGCGFGYLTPLTVGSRWYPNHRGLVNGLAVGLFAAGSGIFGPLAGAVVEHSGWRFCFRLLAGIFFVSTMVGAFMMKEPPVGYRGPAGHAAKKGKPVVLAPDLTTSTVLRQPAFYVLWLAYMMGTTAGSMVISQLVPFGRLAGLDARAAAFAITVGAAGSASGRFLSGWMSDHFGRVRTVAAILVTSAIATPSLYVLQHEIAAFYVFLFFVYYCYGTQLAVYPALSGDFWGTRYLATNYGALMLAWGFAGVTGPQLGSRVFQATGSYEYAFFGAAALALAGLALLATVKTPTHEPVPAGAPAMAGR